MLKDLFRNKMRIAYLSAPKESLREVVEASKILRDIKSKRNIREANEFNKTLVKKLRSVVNSADFSVVALAYNGRGCTTYISLDKYYKLTVPAVEKKKLFADAYSSYVAHKQEERRDAVSVKEDERNELAFKYKTTGGVFTKTGQVLALQSVESQLNRIKIPKKPSATSTKNYIGIELEFISKLSKENLEKELCRNFLGGYVYVHRDGSINTENSNEHAHEIGVLVPDTNYISVIEKLCSVLNSKQVEGYVNNSCGMHVHFDCRQKDPELMYNNFVRVLPLAKQMIPKTRVSSAHAERYCRINNQKTIKGHRDNAVGEGARYYAINPEAYNKYKTIEVRLHSGTLNATKIIMWIKTFLNAANSPLLTEDITTVPKYMTTFGTDMKLAEYMMARIKLFAEKPEAIDTRADHFLFNEQLAI